MAYYLLHLEVAGDFGPNCVLLTQVHPPKVLHLHFELNTWLGDDLLETFPCFLISPRLAQRVIEAKLSGVTFSQAEISASDTFQELHPDEPVPDFLWLQPYGTPGVDDFAVDSQAQLIVSEAALQVLRQGALNHCEVSDYRIE